VDLVFSLNTPADPTASWELCAAKKLTTGESFLNPAINSFYQSVVDPDPAKCCGSGSGIRCLFDPWIRDGLKISIRIWVRIRDEEPGSYFRELTNNILG
jgi:hypothetical protein